VIASVRYVPEAELQSTQLLHGGRLCSRSLDLAHIPMVYGGHMTIVPGNRAVGRMERHREGRAGQIVHDDHHRCQRLREQHP
jgi:hypothetical protein